MKAKLLAVAALAVVLSGCTFKARLFPVRGPLSEKSPLPTFPLKMSGTIKSGSIVAILDGGEVCAGRITFISGKEETSYQTASGDPIVKNLAEAWDVVNGPQFYTGHVLGGSSFAKGDCKSDRGTTMNFQLLKRIKADQSNDTKGVAIDNHGNIFKMAF